VIDPASFIAEQDIRRTLVMMDAAKATKSTSLRANEPTELQKAAGYGNCAAGTCSALKRTDLDQTDGRTPRRSTRRWAAGGHQRGV